ncbi:eukaryotic and archaeal DNA primase, large subunit-domain-containing protein [Pavlovales sp. CCMP2436]|nr:eukaryotic and archaeal DNA primase, large subunit-domain-containing protein [Pavlovales sp. CCMP2436]
MTAALLAGEQDSCWRDATTLHPPFVRPAQEALWVQGAARVMDRLAAQDGPEPKRSRGSGVGSSRKTSLTMYASAPDVELGMSELEECCYMRLRLLRCIDQAKAKGVKGEDLSKVADKAERATMRTSGAWSDEELYRDQCSHFLLRLAFCRTEDLRRYFLTTEVDLFKFRFSFQSSDVERFLRDNGMKYEPISESELEEVQDQLQNVRRASKIGKDVNMSVREDHYMVPFEEVPDLVRSRRVFLRGGFAYVPQSELLSIVGGQYRARLSKALVDTSRAWPSVQEAEADRLSAFLEHCSTQYMTDDYAAEKKVGEGVTLASLPALSKRSFPPCMDSLNRKLIENSHLKHTGRLQLGLFFKGVGLSYDEAIVYWRTIFLKSMSADKFDKEHKVIVHRRGIRRSAPILQWTAAHAHAALPAPRPSRATPLCLSLGQGAKKNFTPYSCAKVITTIPAAGEHHGCPFRSLSNEPLRELLSRMTVKPADVSRIAQKAAENHYQVACGAPSPSPSRSPPVRAWPLPSARLRRMYFEARHAGSSLTETDMGGITHPNQYFDESLKFYANELHTAAETAAEAKEAVVASPAAGLPASPAPAKAAEEGDAAAPGPMAT